MAIYTPTQIYQLALQVGWSPIQAINATAIALAESGGNTSVVNGIGATGLWQIYDGPGMSDSRKAQLQDPLQNAKEAFAKFQSSSTTRCGGWWPWATYNEGPCKNNDPNRNDSWAGFLDIAKAAASGVNTGGGTSSGSSGGGAGSSSGSSGGNNPVATAVGNELAGPVVIAAGLFFLVIGAIIWKGTAVVKVAGPPQAKAAARIAGV